VQEAGAAQALELSFTLANDPEHVKATLARARGPSLDSGTKARLF
jgi:hypothetical protein